VTDDDHTSYRVEVTHARRDKVVDERTAGFFVVLEWVRGTVALTLQKPASQAAEPAASQAAAVSPEASLAGAAAPERRDPSDASPSASAPATSDRRKLIPKAIFWTGVGVTGALLVSYAATDIATYVRYRDLKSSPPPARSQGDWDAAHRLQIADRTLLGFTLAAAAATTVMYFFTEFESSEPSEAPLAPPEIGGMGGRVGDRRARVVGWGPFPLPGGGGLVVEGRF
jgi:hypothetical protein